MTNKNILAVATLLISNVAFSESDTIGLTGDIAQAVTVDIANSSTPVIMTNATTTSENVVVAANVPFTIAVTSANGLTMKSGNDSVAYGFTIKDAGGTTILSSAGSASHNEVAETWTFNITPTGIDGSTDSGTYSDTVTITVAAQ